MEMKERFGDRVADYVKWRPGYPVEIVRILEREAGISPARTPVVDLGSGTGISAELFLREGYAVVGVEPSAPMREASERLLAGYTEFTAVDGTAEHTTLKDACCGLVVAAQSFHWFDRTKARAEIARILAPGGVAALVWNARRIDTPFLRAYEDALLRFGIDYAKVCHRGVGEDAIADFFRGRYVQRVAPNHQDFDLEGVIGRTMSSVYVPKEGPNHDALMKEIARIFDAFQQNGKVRFTYDCKVWFGPLS
jgi:SAM-dependent methyltransferase